MRAVAVLLVVVIHADHWPLQEEGADLVVWTTVDRLARVAVPLFVILTGFLLTYRRQAELSRSAFARRRFGRSLLPWLTWTPVYLAIGLWLTAEVPRDLSGVVSWWLQGGGHLWYLILVPQLYLLFLAWPRSTVGMWAAAGLSLAVQAALGAYRLWAPASSPLNAVFLPYGFELCCCWIGYFGLGSALGHLFVTRRPRWPAWPWALIAAVGLVLIVIPDVSGAPNASFLQGTGEFLLPTLPLLTVGAFVALLLSAGPVLHRHPRLRGAATAISRHSLGIYILHGALMYVPGRMLGEPLELHLPLSAVAFLLLVTSSLVGALLATRLAVATPIAITLGNRREDLPRRIPLAHPE